KRRVQSARNDRYVHATTQRTDQLAAAQPLAGGQRDPDDLGLLRGDAVDDLVGAGVHPRADETDLVAMRAQVRADETRSDRSHRPGALRIDFEEDDSHGHRRAYHGPHALASLAYYVDRRRRHWRRLFARGATGAHQPCGCS